jgi:hypothetical protein
MRIPMKSTLPTLLVIAILGCSNATGDACNNVLGEYAWFIGGKVAFGSRGTVRWMPAVATIPPATGTWTCSPDSGTYTVTWQNGFIDTLNLSADGSTLSGISSTGVRVTGHRSAQADKTTTPVNASKPTTDTQNTTDTTTQDGWTPIGNAGMGKQSTVPIGPNGPQRIGPQGRPPPKGAG